MRRFSSKIAFSIITAGLFIVVCFAALNMENLTTPFYMVTGALIAFIFLFGFAMGNTYASPVKELLKEAINNGTSKLKPHIKTKDEIEELSKALGKITDGLSKVTEDAETQKKSADIKLKTKDIISEKVIDALEEKVKNRTAELDRAMAELDTVKAQLAQKNKEIADLTQSKKKK